MPLPGLKSLNRPEVVTSRDQRWPDNLGGEHTAQVLSFKFIPGTKENRNHTYFRARVKLTRSDKPEVIGREYTISMFVSAGEYEDKDYQRIREFVAACMGQNAGDAGFDADAAQQTMLDSSASGALDSGECVIAIQTVTKAKVGFDKKSGAPLTGNNVFFNFFKV